MSEAQKPRPIAEWLASSFRLLPEPETDEGAMRTLVFNTGLAEVVAASPSGLLKLATKPAHAFETVDADRNPLYLNTACPVLFGIFEAAAKKRTDPFPSPFDDTTELMQHAVSCGREETLRIFAPFAEHIGQDAVMNGTGSIDLIEERLKSLVEMCVFLATGEDLKYGTGHHLLLVLGRFDRMYEALLAVKFTIGNAETHPRYMANRAAQMMCMATMLDAHVPHERLLEEGAKL